MKGGFAESPLRMNQGLGKIEHWNEEAIRQRAETLAAKAVNVWPAPKLEAAVLEAYKPKATMAGYTIDDHPYLTAGPLREVFEAFRKQVLALDACVTEEFLKLYVAYKAETTDRCAKVVKFSQSSNRPGQRRIGPNEASGEDVPLPSGIPRATLPGPDRPGCASPHA
jgi:hypothetical protein